MMRKKPDIRLSPNFHSATLGFNIIIIAFILTVLSLGGGKLNIELVLFTTLVCVVLTKSGELILRSSRLTSIKAWLPIAFVVGFVAISLPMMALALMFKLSALEAFWITALPVLGLSVFTSRKYTITPLSSWTDPAITLVFAVMIGILAHIPISSPVFLLDTGILPIWSDYYLHGITIASFGSPFASGGDLMLAGVHRVFYHYAPFMLSAAFQPISSMSGLALSTSLLLPLGLLIAVLGSYGFAVELVGGRLGGLLAITLLILPTPASYFIQSGWFDFYWLLFTAPGSGYAIGVAAVVCASTLAYLKHKDKRVLCFSLLLLGSLVLIRVHMFLLLAPAIAAVMIIDRWHTYRRLLFIIVITALTIMVLALYFSAPLYTLWMEYGKPHDYLNFCLQWSSIYEKMIKPVLTSADNPNLFVQILIVLLAILGIYVVLYPCVFWLGIKRFGFHAQDALPWLLIAIFIALMLFAPVASNGDLTEYKHRHFPLLYVIIVIYTVSSARALAIIYGLNENKLKPWIYTLVTVIFATSILLNWKKNPAQPNLQAMPWGKDYFNLAVTQGLPEAAQYLKTQSKSGDMLAMDASSVTSILHTPVNEFIALSGIPAFIAYSDLKMKRSPCVQNIELNRMSLLQQLSSIDHWTDARKIMQSNDIRWFVLISGQKPKWDPELRFPVFSKHGVSIYDIGHSAKEIFSTLQC